MKYKNMIREYENEVKTAFWPGGFYGGDIKKIAMVAAASAVLLLSRYANTSTREIPSSQLETLVSGGLK